MSASTLVSVLDQIETLTTNELRQVGAIVQKRLARQNEISSREAFYQALVMQGLVKAIKPASGSAARAAADCGARQANFCNYH